MQVKELQTTGDIARRYCAPGWLVRRIVDVLSPPVLRIRWYRLLTVAQAEQVEAELRRRGYAKEAARA
jgi:hypothetical protein